MLEALQIAGRLTQYALLLPLFGLAAFGLYARRAALLLPMRVLPGALALAGLAAALFALIAQTAAMTGAASEAVKPDMLWTVLSGTHYGLACCVRIAALIATLLALRAPRWGLPAACFLTGIAMASMAWGGHGAAGEGAAGLFRLAADIVHLWAAGLWIGALIAFCLLVFRPSSDDHWPAARALAAFSGLGSAIAATLVLTGLINSAFLVPLNKVANLLATPWGRVLAIKLIVFGAMICLAAANRFILTPRLAGALDQPSRGPAPLSGLRNSLALETALAIGVLALVAVLGTLPPPASG